MTSSVPDPKEIARRYVEVARNDGDVEEPLSEFKGFIQGYHQAFPDLHFAVDAYIAEGDLVSFWGRTTGTHEGSLMGLEPTGNRIDIMGINTVRVEDGKVAERWANFDLFGMLQQLGHNPLPE